MSGLYGPFIGKAFRDISHVPEFEKDLKRLARRFSGLESDLVNFIKFALIPFHKLATDSKAVFHISDLGIISPRIYKAKKFACRALKGKGAQSGIRIIYAWHEEEDRIEFIEIYYKGDKETEDRGKILKYFANQTRWP